MVAARQRQDTQAFKTQYAARAGIEGNACAGHPRLWLAAGALLWVAEDPFAARADRRLHECRPLARLDGQPNPSPDPDITLSLTRARRLTGICQTISSCSWLSLPRRR